jgi:hypothetical protein
MKALAFQAGEMDHHNGTVWTDTSLSQLSDGSGWRFEGRNITAFGIIGPEYVRTELKERLERHRTLDSALLQRIATYEVEETNWAALIAVEGLGGIHYLRRMPGMVSSLIYYPLVDSQAIVITHRSTKPKFLEKDQSRNVLSAIKCCMHKHA